MTTLAILLGFAYATATGNGFPAVVTAYCPGKCCCGPKACGVTASGKKFQPYVSAAADWRFVPRGTKLRVGGRTWTVQDKGGAIKGQKLDLGFPNHHAAAGWGKQTLWIELKP
jgi:3D (Asp-Asp-Asp) domain-containing protein